MTATSNSDQPWFSGKSAPIKANYFRQGHYLNLTY